MTKSEQDSVKQYRIIAIVVLIAFVLVIASILGYKKITDNKDDSINIVLNDGDLVINYVDGQNIKFKGKKSHSYLVSVTNNSTEKLFYSLDLDDVYANNGVVVSVYDEDNSQIFSEENVNSDITLFSLLPIEAGETVRCTVTLSPTKNTDFTATLNIINDSLTTQTFSDLLLLNNNISVAKTKVGSEIGSSDEGLITSNDDDGISYYFRGNVKNNYVVINDLTFRVVRINGDGTVRLVLDDVIAKKTAYNTNTLGEGETIEQMALLEKSSVLNTLNEWYKDSLSQYDSIISTGKYCSETSFTNLNGGFYRSDTYNRLYFSLSPSLQCSGTVYTSKVGLLSADEVTLAGAYQNNENKGFYLYNENITDSVLLSSSDYINSNNELIMFVLNPDGSLDDSFLAGKMASIRPVIDLSMSAKVKGKGTLENPYIIVS